MMRRDMETDFLRPGPFGAVAAADSRRIEFDLKNESILSRKHVVDTVFLGDSITHFWELSVYFTSVKGLIINRGIAGDTTEFMVRRFVADVVQLHPRRVVILAGINDLWSLEAFPWIIDPPVPDRKSLAIQVVTNLRLMLDTSMDAGIMPVLCSILPTSMEWTTHTSERNRFAVDVNQQLCMEASASGIPYINYHAQLTDSDGLSLRSGLSRDGLHPHQAGYHIMAETLLAGLPDDNNTLRSA